jgi:hypothetical protein
MEHYLDLCRRSKIIMDTKGVLIRVYRNASGFLWGMEKSDSGTDLGWSDFRGDCQWSGTFTTYEKALEDAVTLVETYGTPEDFKKATKVGQFHWGNYADWLVARDETEEVLKPDSYKIDSWKEAIRNMTPEDKEKFFPEDTTPKGWVSIEEHLPTWMASDIMEGGTMYKVKYKDGAYGGSFVSDHNIWYYMAKEQGITHWWNP